MGDISEYVTVAQAADLLGLSKSRVEQYIRSGSLAVASIVGNVRLLRRADVELMQSKVRGKAGRPPKPAAEKPPPKAPRKRKSASE
jgi:excisionase family DNA binding protein